MRPSPYSSSFHEIAAATLRDRAARFVMWSAGHGADAPTLRSHLDSLLVFPSHFAEWANPLSPAQILEAIPLLSRTGLAYSVGGGTSAQPLPDPVRAPGPTMPAVVAHVVTLALQDYMMRKDRPNQTLSWTSALSDLIDQPSPFLRYLKGNLK